MQPKSENPFNNILSFLGLVSTFERRDKNQTAISLSSTFPNDTPSVVYRLHIPSYQHSTGRNVTDL